MTCLSEAQAHHREEPEIDADQCQDPDNGLFAATPYETDDEKAVRIYEGINYALDSHRGVLLHSILYSPTNPFFCLHFSEKHNSKRRLQKYALRGPIFC